MRRMQKDGLAALLVCGLAALLLSCGGADATGKATVAEAEQFMEKAEAQLLDLWIRSGHASWAKATDITEEHEALEAQALEALIAATAELAAESTRFDELELPPDLARKIRKIKTSLPLVAPRDSAKQAELTKITTSMESVYGKGKYCPEGGGDCLDLTEMTRILANSRDANELLDLWVGWRTISPPMRSQYERFVELANEGARELGFSDLGELWRSGYDMPPDDFYAELQRLWEQVQPLYTALHCHVRARLAETYGADVVPQDQPIPAHLLGNMWSQSWGNVYELVKPETSETGYDVTKLLVDKGLDAKEMVGYGERFFTSLGFEKLPETFWNPVVVYETGGPRGGLPCQRVGPGLRRRPADQDVHRHHGRGFHDDPSRAGPQLLPAGVRRSVAAVPGKRQRRIPRGDRRHDRAVDHAGVPGAGRPAGQSARYGGGSRPIDAHGAGQDRVSALRAAGRPATAGMSSPVEYSPADYNRMWWELRTELPGHPAAGGTHGGRTSTPAPNTTSRRTSPIRGTSWPTSCSFSSTDRCARWPASRARCTAARFTETRKRENG